MSVYECIWCVCIVYCCCGYPHPHLAPPIPPTPHPHKHPHHQVGQVSTPTANVSQALQRTTEADKIPDCLALLGEEVAEAQRASYKLPLTIVFVERKKRYGVCGVCVCVCVDVYPGCMHLGCVY